MSEAQSVFYIIRSMSEVQSVFYMIRFHVRSPVRLLYYTFYVGSPVRLLYCMVPCRKFSPSFVLYGSMSEVQSVFYFIRFHVRNPVRLLNYTVPCRKSNPSFMLYGSMSEVQFVFYIIRFHVRSPVRLLDYTFHVRSPVRLLYYTVTCQKSSPSFKLYGSMSEVQSVFYIIRFHVGSSVCLLYYSFHVGSPVRLLCYTVPCRKSSPSFILYGSMSEVQSDFYLIRFHVSPPDLTSFKYNLDGVRIMVFNATFYNISVILWRSVLLVEETRVPGQNQKLASSH